MALDLLSVIDKGLSFFIGIRNDREIEKLKITVQQILDFEPKIKALDDDALKAQTVKLREKLAAGATLDDVLPEAFATVREASVRILQMRHYDVQMMGGIILHQGKIAEMRTGEGKTLVATLPLYLNALNGKSQLVTVNEYLAARDAGKEGKVFEFLGMTVGVIHSMMSHQERIDAYNCDITYGTNSEFGFDYLRDNMKTRKESQAQKSLNFVVIDEVDSILVDEARTPLIISGPTEQKAEIYAMVDKKVRQLKEGIHYNVSEKDHSVVMTEEGIERIEQLLGVGDLYSGKNMHLPHFIDNALRAHHLFHVDQEYMIAPDPETQEISVMIVDEFTGRTMPGRRWSDGLHQAVEAKEGIAIKEESQTLATITYQNFFKLFKKMSGMTGTALTEAKEFSIIYKLDVVEIPTNKPMIRMDMDDLIYGTSKEKYEAIVDEILFNHKLGRPILVGTVAIENSELISGILSKRGIKHNVLNAKQHAREAEIVANAGTLGAVTIATNMAGRGTDIVLKSFTINDLIAHWKQHGMCPKDLDPSEKPEVIEKAIRKHWAQVFLGVNDGSIEEAQKNLAIVLERHGIKSIGVCENGKGLGGLLIIGTERHDSRRIDNQLRGRSGRQGDPGASQFYLSLEDNLMRIFGGEMIKRILRSLGLTNGEAMDHPMVSRSIEKAQKKVEDRNFSIRKNLLEYDGVMSDQRKIIYRERQQILDGVDLKNVFTEKINETIERTVSAHMNDNILEPERDYKDFVLQMKAKFNIDVDANEVKGKPESSAFAIVQGKIKRLYEDKESKMTPAAMRELERFLLLQVIDQKWKDHLHAMDHLKEGIHLRAQAQKDPKVEYKREGYELFILMSRAIIDDVVSLILHVEISAQEEKEIIAKTEIKAEKEMVLNYEEDKTENIPTPSSSLFELSPIVNSESEVGRNDVCPCGSGKKYKKCHGKDSA
jgi:preprotein translocase subunit SecA